MKTIIALLFIAGPFAVNAQQQVKEVNATNTTNTSTVSVSKLETAPNKVHTKKPIDKSNASMRKDAKQAVKVEEAQPLVEPKN